MSAWGPAGWGQTSSSGSGEAAAPSIDYASLTYAGGFDADYNTVLRARYLFFDGGGSTHWQIKAGVTLPASVADTGDTGFVIEDVATQTINIIFANDQLVGGTGLDGGALSTSDDLMVSIDPGGGVTDITSAGWTVGARWSGWCADTAGSSSSMTGKDKVSAGADWLFIRTKTASGYTSGCFAGRMARLDGGIGGGFCIFGGDWYDIGEAGYDDHCAIEAFAENWVGGRVTPSNDYALTGDVATDGADDRYAPLAIQACSGAANDSGKRWATLGTCPALYAGPSGSAGDSMLDEEAAVIGKSMTGGALYAADDGTVAE